MVSGASGAFLSPSSSMSTFPHTSTVSQTLLAFLLISTLHFCSLPLYSSPLTTHLILPITLSIELSTAISGLSPFSSTSSILQSIGGISTKNSSGISNSVSLLPLISRLLATLQAISENFFQLTDWSSLWANQGCSSIYSRDSREDGFWQIRCSIRSLKSADNVPGGR